jgi:hypothetical protein
VGRQSDQRSVRSLGLAKVSCTRWSAIAGALHTVGTPQAAYLRTSVLSTLPVPERFCGSPGMIVGDDTRTRVRSGHSEPGFPHAATTLARPREAPGARHGKTAHREGSGAGSSPARHDPRQRGPRSQRPQRRPYGRVPAMIVRTRLRAGAAIPGRLSTHPLCPPIAGHGGTARSPQLGRRGAHDFHPPLLRPKTLLTGCRKTPAGGLTGFWK